MTNGCDTDGNIGLCPVRPADMLSAALVSAGFKTRWAQTASLWRSISTVS
jgi:hypothetical protein